jgi:threonine synthase
MVRQNRFEIGRFLEPLGKMVEAGEVDRDERVVLFNTGSGLKYADLFTAHASVADPKIPFDYKSL